MVKKILLILSLTLFSTVGMIAQGNSDTAPAATPAPAKKPVAFRSTKDQVKEAQNMLKAKKLYSGEATGTSSPEWKTALKAWQGDNGLTKSGSLNRATLEKMGIELTDKQKEIPADPKHLATSEKKPAKSTTKSGSLDLKLEKVVEIEPGTSVIKPNTAKKPAPFRANVDQIKAAQKMLKDGKMYSGEETGKLDDVTRDGLGKYQDANGVKVTKTLNAVTLEKMGIALTDKQKERVAAQAAYDAAKSRRIKSFLTADGRRL